MDSILKLAHTEGMLFKYGSGTGTNLSPIRSSMEQLAGGGTAWLGSGDRLSDKLVAVLTLIDRERVGSGTIDVSVPTAPVLTTGPAIGNFSTRTGG